ncbi:hypothetical protein D1872_231090 [compost metagenome]
MRGGHDDLPALRNHLVHIQGDIAGSRRQIKQHVIQFAPIYVVKELPKHFPEHGTAPNNRVVILDKKAHGHHFDAEPFYRNDRPFLHGGGRLDSHHIRHAETVNVRVDQTDPLPLSGQCCRQIDGNGRFPDPAFSAGNGYEMHARLGIQNRQMLQSGAMTLYRPRSFRRLSGGGSLRRWAGLGRLHSRVHSLLLRRFAKAEMHMRDAGFGQTKPDFFFD